MYYLMIWVIHKAIREKCDQNAPKVLLSACQKLIKGLRLLDGEKIRKPPDEICSTVCLKSSEESDSDDDDDETIFYKGGWHNA
ncbi:hypothetical protein COOONC_22153 [Cooperia oncophora]